MTATSIVGYLALFVTVGILFLFVNLMVGWLLRPSDPTPEKGEVYECGEPTIGSSFVQFDLRFYVVALLFIIFDVEVAFFFPWAVVFGTAARDGQTGDAASLLFAHFAFLEFLAVLPVAFLSHGLLEGGE